MSSKRLTIRNLYKTDGVNIAGVNIDMWITLDDYYEFLAYYQGHKWMYKLYRLPNADDKYALIMEAPSNQTYSVYLGLNEIKIKRLFYKRIAGLVEDHISRGISLTNGTH